ncbi:hypothetical protein TanjilG_18901 [Lupinus angustifolius]|uniref:Peptidase M50 domain-containing protein n=1 Tax=Lupinus angustifolius TaxID=3871 RepID=A0A4P1RQJ3_LUPAN|nr:hypothetical protein TanjilG_18901 [Lupinus angustifolius]
MNFSLSTSPFRGNFIPLSLHSTSCFDFDLRFKPYLLSSNGFRRSRCCRSSFKFIQDSRLSRKRVIVCNVTEPHTEPDGNNEEEEDAHQNEETQALENSFEQNSPQPIDAEQLNKFSDENKDQNDVQEGTYKNEETQALENSFEQNSPQPIDAEQLNKFSDENKDQNDVQEEGTYKNEETRALENSFEQNSPQPIDAEQLNKFSDENKDQNDVQSVDSIEVASGSPLPGVKPRQLGEAIKIPKETIDILKNQVFGFDTFFVTSQDPYEDKFGNEYKFFLLVNPEDDKPVAVVVPRTTLQPETTAVPEWFAAGAFGLVTVFTLLLHNVPVLQSDLLSTFYNLNLLKDGLPGALVTGLVLGIHELGHFVVAQNTGVKLGVPFFVPSWQIGSFGAITRIRSIVPNREDLLKVAAAGPIAGFSLGLLLLLLGFVLPPSDGIGIIVDASVFHESFLAGGIAKLLLGNVLKDGTPISVNPLVIWAWAGLLINAINSIPAGELDGGRISFAIWGRKASFRFTGVSIVLLGLSSLINDVAFYWVVLLFFLQRGPIAPLSDEITDPDQKYVALGVTVLLLGLLVCLPYPFPFTDETLISF